VGSWQSRAYRHCRGRSDCRFGCPETPHCTPETEFFFLNKKNPPKTAVQTYRGQVYPLISNVQEDLLFSRNAPLTECTGRALYFLRSVSLNVQGKLGMYCIFPWVYKKSLVIITLWIVSTTCRFFGHNSTKIIPSAYAFNISREGKPQLSYALVLCLKDNLELHFDREVVLVPFREVRWNTVHFGLGLVSIQ
jgi:hypothetical protein